MILSMTGYGQATGHFGDKVIKVEIKSLNGKTSDVRIKTPGGFKEKEILIRKIVLDHALRGKFDVSVSFSQEEGDNEFALNRDLFKKYYKELSELSKECGIENGDILQTILRIPNVVSNVVCEIDENEWQTIKTTLKQALENLREYREREGQSTKKDLQIESQKIAGLLKQIAPHESNRIENLKIRFRKNLEEFMGDSQVDHNRFEQEIIYYLEKLDINEEKVRLHQHCIYFDEILNNGNVQVGKKLGFIAQEMGREINTLGAKAQEKNIQKVVVEMKEALEKIKEQVANIV